MQIPERDKLSLIQICDVKGNVFIIQPNKNNYKAPNLVSVLENDKILKIGHFLRFDKNALEYFLKCKIKNIFDTKIASKIGSQSVVLQIDVKHYEGEYRCFTHGARELSSVSFVDWLSSARELGVGEVHITSIDTEGTNHEFPLSLAEICCSLTQLPLIVSGGFRSASHIAKIYSDFDVKAFSLSSYTNILGKSISELRNELTSLGVPVRNP